MRWRGHYEGDPQRYRPEEELARLPELDPASADLVLGVLKDRDGDPAQRQAAVAAIAQAEAARELARSS